MKKTIVYDFAEAINQHHIEKVFSLITYDHVFIDAHGNSVEGKNKMKAGWAGYFQLFPDYKIDITDVFEDGDTIAAFGFAEGTFKGRIKTASNKNYWHSARSSESERGRWENQACGKCTRIQKIPSDIIGKL